MSLHIRGLILRCITLGKSLKEYGEALGEYNTAISLNVRQV